MLDQDSSFDLINLNILITFLLNNVWNCKREGDCNGASLFMFYLFCMSFAAFSDSITDIVQK